LGTVNRQQVAALAGLAPYDRASGTHDGKRAIYGGRKRIRKALYLAALTASRWSPWLKEVYTALRKKGKCAKVALIACARKLLVRLNSLVSNARGNQTTLAAEVTP
jgi:transposase